MMLRVFTGVFCFLFYWTSSVGALTFIPDKKHLEPYMECHNTILVASTGHSGSTMLSATIDSCMPNHKVLKTHILPPLKQFSGKIVFIYSNPDLATESVLHKSLRDPVFGHHHFLHMESSDLDWLEELEWDTTKQTETINLLAYDALGVKIQLEEWLHHQTTPCKFEDADILALKLENLWEQETIQALRDFLGSPDFTPPPEKKRGYSDSELLANERQYRNLYNLGTYEQPVYPAYDEARRLWETAPPFQFLRIK